MKIKFASDIPIQRLLKIGDFPLPQNTFVFLAVGWFAARWGFAGIGFRFLHHRPLV